MKRNCLSIVKIFCLSLTVIGCSSQQVRIIDDPVAKVSSVTQTAHNPKASRVVVLVEINNTNDVPLPVDEAHYEIDIKGVGKFDLTQAGNHTLSKMGTQHIELPASFKTDHDLAGAEYKISGWVSYQTPGEIRRFFTESGYPLPRVSFSGSGQIQ